MALEMYRTDRIERDYTVTVTDKFGAPVTVTTVQVALLPHRTTPTAATTWASKTVTAGVTTLTYAAPDVTPIAGDLLPAAGLNDLFFRDVNASFTDATLIEVVTVT